MDSNARDEGRRASSPWLHLRYGLLLLAVAFASTPEARAEAKAARVFLPTPDTIGSMSVEEALATRRSRRRVAKEALSDATIGQLLWAAQGITAPAKGFRTAPSAGARYPLRVYLLVPSGLFAYEPRGHSLLELNQKDLRVPFWKAVYGRAVLVHAPAMILIAADYTRTSQKYGTKAIRFVHMEAGHAAQNLLLQATALGLHGVGVGAFDAVRTRRAIDLPIKQELLYVLVVGKPKD